MRRASLCLLLLAAACQPSSSDGGAGDGDSGVADAGSSDAGAPDSGLDDAGAPDGGLADSGCGACATTELVATFGTTTAPFDRAQHGVENDGGGVYVEAHFGGDPACPGPSSPTPDRTLIIAGLRWPGDGGAQTYADGVRVTLLDFRGTLSPHPFDRATAVRAVPRGGRAGGVVSFSLEATFDGGSVAGGVEAPHCASLDGP